MELERGGTIMGGVFCFLVALRGADSIPFH